MGLDNVIYLKLHNKLDLDDWEIMPEYADIEFDEYITNSYGDGYYYTVCYWRKCWGLRADILSILNIDPNSMSDDEEDDGRYDIDTDEQIIQIRDVLISYLEHPDDWFSQIWTMKEMIPHIAQDIVNLSWLLNFRKEHKQNNIIFVDSY